MIAFSLCSSRIYSQVTESSSQQQLSMPDDFNFREKIFLHIDRKLYLSGEIIWFKGYCTYREMNILSDVSKVMYVELLDNKNQSIMSEKIILDKGTGNGTILIPRSVQTGIYYIRAYTRWMTNFPPEYWFSDKVYIVNPFLPVETFVMQGVSDDYTISYYIEGAKLLYEQKNEIVFHVKSQTGRGINLKGWVVNQSGDTMTVLNTLGSGYGLFSFTPVSNSQYRVITISSDGMRKEMLLPFPVIDGTSVSNSDGKKPVEEPEEMNITLKADKDVYAPRERVTLIIGTKNPEGKSLSSNLSLSVYKSDHQSGFNHKNISQYLNRGAYLQDNFSYPDDQFSFAEYNSDTLKRILQIIYSCTDTAGKVLEVPSDHTYILPETRGLTLTGTVNNSPDGNTASGIKVYISQPGKTAQIYTTTSGGFGRFQVRLLNQYGRNDIIGMPAVNPDNYFISLDEDFSSRYSEIEPEFFYPDDKAVGYIERLMINLQVEDAFGNFPVRKVDMKQYELPDIYGDPDETVLLEDYIKLPAVEELFYELVKSVLIKRKRNNNFELQIIDPATKVPVPGSPLFLVDGVPVHDINPVIIYMDPVNIEKIDVVTARFVQGNESYHGIINVVTKQADFNHFDLPSYAIRKPYQFFQVPCTFNSPDYFSVSDSIRSHPDFRNLLYWNPEIVTDNTGTATVSFYTADDITDYRIVIQGLSEDGLAGYQEATISVK